MGGNECGGNDRNDKNYVQKLKTSANETGSIVCMGLDPVLEAIPGYRNSTPKVTITEFYQQIFDRMKEEGVSPGAFKPNQGFFERFDNPAESSFEGSETLSDVIFMLWEQFPKVPIILDYKRGDIATSSTNYAQVGKNWNVDALTVAPYMGTDSVMPFVNTGLGVYVLDRTSNPGGSDIQNLKVISNDDVYKTLENILIRGGPRITSPEYFADVVRREVIPALRNNTKPVYMVVAGKIIEWGKDNQGVGAVVGATNMNELRDIAQFLGPYYRPLLIPGVGSQGGSAGDVAFTLNSIRYDMGLVRINSSSGLTHPWKKAENAPKDWEMEVVKGLKKLNEEIGYVPK